MIQANPREFLSAKVLIATAILVLAFASLVSGLL